MRSKPHFEEEPEVPFSPLIDCVFLLLIFFLVTTVIKRYESQIPVKQPSSAVTMSQQANRSAYIISVDAHGKYYRENGIRSEDGAVQYAPVSDLALHMKMLAQTRGIDTPIHITGDKDSTVQMVLKAYDICVAQNFKTIGVKLRDAKAIHPEDRDPSLRTPEGRQY